MLLLLLVLLLHRRRRQELGPSLIDVDDTYIIDGEGQPAILALDAHVIPLAHAHAWPTDGTNSLNASHSGNSSYVLRQVALGNGVGRGGGNSPSWARAVLGMGHSVTESIGRAAGLAIRSNGGGSSGGSSACGGVGGGGAGNRRGARGGGGGGVGGGQGGRNGGGQGADGYILDDACSGVAAVAGRGASVAGSAEPPGSSLSSWRGMRSGATWAFGGGGSIDRRSGGRKDGGGVYPTAAAALGLGLAPHPDLEEKSEAAATGGGTSGASGGGSSSVGSAASNNNNNNNNNNNLEG
ncbi:unnamed protein product, partial [Hapterophycus canaliculatus]